MDDHRKRLMEMGHMDLMISTNASGRQALVERASSGKLRGDAFIVRPGETLFDVPYDAWLPRVGETVDPRELLPPSARPSLEQAEPREREQGFWTTPLGPKARAVFSMSVGVALLQDDFHDPVRTSLETAWLALFCALWVYVGLDTIVELPLPKWVFYALLAAVAVLTGITILG